MRIEIDFRCTMELDQEGRTEAQDAIRNLVLMIPSLTMCGHTELRPSQASTGTLFKMLNFTLPQPTNRGKYQFCY